MANNKIQIKRSVANSTVTGLANGELAFTANGNILYIGDPAGGSAIPIGGKFNYGTLTANQALVTNSTSAIDKIITANLTLGGASVTTINAVANLTHLGAPSNNELTTTWAIKTFVDAKIAQASNPQGSNGQFQYNDSGVLNGTNNMVFDNTTGQITIGNTSTNVQLGFTGSVNSMAHFHGNQNSYVQVIMQNVNNGTRASSDFIAENDLGSELENYVDLGINSSTYNDAGFSAMGAGDAYLYTANNDLIIGAADVGGEVKFITGGTTSSQIRAVIDGNGNVGIGNTAPNAKLQVTGTANISGLVSLSSNLVLSTTTAVVANGTVGTAGQVLTSNATTVYWSTPAAGVSGSDTQIQYNDGGNLAGAAGLTFTKSTNNVTISNSLFVTGSVNAASHTVGTAFTANSTVVNAVSYYSGTLLVANTTVVNATHLGGTAAAGYQTTAGLAANVATLTANNATNLGGVAAAAYVQNTDSRVLSGNLAFSGANITFSGANLTVTGTNTSISSNVTVTGASITGTATDVSFRNGTFSGNLAVFGTVVTVNTSQLVVNDNIIEFGAGNITTDIVDTGFFSPAGNSTAVWYSGIARIAASSTNTSPVFRVFASNTNPNTSATIDTTANTRTGFLQSYLIPYGSGGALVANATNITIVANSTVEVSITANSLTLSTPLSGTNGGTGLSTIANNSLIFGNSTNGFNALALGTSGYVLQSNGTAIVYDVLDGGTF
jgi:hypothetical protein